MKKIIFYLALIIGNINCLYALAPKFEVRAAWITNVYGLDWPRTRATNLSNMHKQQQELIEILDKLKSANFNTVLFQARARGDVFYQSEYEPFNAILTGEVGKYPGYDPLAFAIEECHKRGMECHAWMVALPLGGFKHVRSLGKLSVTKKQKSICIPYKREYFLNPANPNTKQYLMNLVKEVVKNYDVDGVHFDYLRYPEYARRFPDRQSFAKYGKGRDIEQFRRDNLTEILRYIYQGVKALKPWVKVSTCPVGKYDDTSRYSSRGWNAYHAVHQDVQGWMGEGIQDQVYPMMYFKGNSFYPFALDWQEQSNGCQVIPGLGIYFLHPKEGNWNIEEIERQIKFLRNNGMAGQAHYRVQFLMDNTKNLYNLLTLNYYQNPALQPALTKLDSIRPNTPTGLTIQEEADGYVRLTWQASTDNDSLNKPKYVVYASSHFPVDINNPANIVAQGIANTTYLYSPLLPWKKECYFTVTAVDRYGNESNPAKTDKKQSASESN